MNDIFKGSATPTALSGIAPELARLLGDNEIVEISCNAGGEVYVERFGSDPVLSGSMARATIDYFLRWCATHSDTAITPEQPVYSGRIPGTPHRIEGLIPPVVDSPAFSIRRHTDHIITLETYIPAPQPRAILEQAIAERTNILIAGGTGSGKTTLLNACLDHLAQTQPQTRLLTIEDTPELRPPLKNLLCLHTSDTIGMDRLLVSSLRLAPDRIVVGEVREGRVLLTLVKAWNTGHPGGFVTLHANSAREIMPRLEALAMEVPGTDPAPALKAAAGLMIFVHRGRDRPVVQTILGRTENTELETLYET